MDLSPTVHPWARFYVDEVQRVMKSDQDPDTHWPITDETLVHEDIQRMFGEFSYQKGGSIVGMMESILTKPTSFVEKKVTPRTGGPNRPPFIQ